MAYNKLNKLRFYCRIIDIVNANYIEDVTTYSGIWRQYVDPVYPMCYHTFLKIINMPNLRKQLAEAEAEAEEKNINKTKNND